MDLPLVFSSCIFSRETMLSKEGILNREKTQNCNRSSWHQCFSNKWAISLLIYCWWLPTIDEGTNFTIDWSLIILIGHWYNLIVKPYQIKNEQILLGVCYSHRWHIHCGLHHVYEFSYFPHLILYVQFLLAYLISHQTIHREI